MSDHSMPTRNTSDRDKQMPAIIAHRGASGYAPENTLAAIRLAAGQGARWIEIDVNISSDGVPLLWHDDGVERCSNGEGLVIEHSLQSLKALDVGSWYSAQFSNEKIATLEECLQLCLELDVGINLEIKPCSGWEVPTTEAIADHLMSQSSLPEIVVSSFSHTAMRCASERLADLPRSCLYLVTPPDWQALTSEVGANNIHLHANSLLQEDQIDAFHNSGLGVYCYTVNTPEQAGGLFDKGVDGVFTNYPDLLLKAHG